MCHGVARNYNRHRSPFFYKRPKTPTDDKPLISVAKKPLLVDLNLDGSAEELFLNKK
jgi:hypothetical protein